MHFTEIDNWLKKCLNEHPWGAQILTNFGLSDIDQLFIEINQNIKQRRSVGIQLISQYDLQSSTFGYLFSPFIASLLNYKACYVTTESMFTQQQLSHHFDVEALKISEKSLLTEMNLSFDFVESTQTALYFEIYSLIKALLNPNISHFFLIDGLYPEIKKLADQYQLPVYAIKSIHAALDADIQYKSLFWKKKNESNSRVCQNITRINTALFIHLNHFKNADLERLIDDFMYGEHLFEKISVVGEFSETILKNHLEKIKTAC